MEFEVCEVDGSFTGFVGIGVCVFDVARAAGVAADESLEITVGDEAALNEEAVADEGGFVEVLVVPSGVPAADVLSVLARVIRVAHGFASPIVAAGQHARFGEIAIEDDLEFVSGKCFGVGTARLRGVGLGERASLKNRSEEKTDKREETHHGEVREDEFNSSRMIPEWMYQYDTSAL